uniref:Uncharacterized protein n=1 Tax=Euplotes crassus TaxID=5936 RepID=A0A7S3KDW8_EUPCR|mmetsp:Transcript_20701/g.20444  ORF Transcript_20701/g.20444 Transcript_20701/m.20444 type:complete len:121 (+) Transcript_20701:264-626(+)
MIIFGITIIVLMLNLFSKFMRKRAIAKIGADPIKNQKQDESREEKPSFKLSPRMNEATQRDIDLSMRKMKEDESFKCRYSKNDISRGDISNTYSTHINTPVEEQKSPSPSFLPPINRYKN